MTPPHTDKGGVYLGDRYLTDSFAVDGASLARPKFLKILEARQA